MSGSAPQRSHGSPGTLDDKPSAVRTAVERLRRADSQLEKYQREREQALRELRNTGCSPVDNFRNVRSLVQSPSAASDISFPESVRERARLARQSIDDYLDVDNVAAINSINSLAKANRRGEDLMKAADAGCAAFQDWKRRNLSEVRALIVNPENHAATENGLIDFVNWTTDERPQN